MANQTTTDATIFEARRGDHDKQRNLVDLITKTSGESDGRVELFERLSAQLEAHAAAEERDFSVPLMQQDLTQKAARHSVAEHKELDDLVEKLREYDMSAEYTRDMQRHLDED